MTMISRIALIACLLCSWINSANALCNLCSSGVQGIKWPFSVLDSSGTTCSQKAVEMARISNNGQCNSEINKYRSKCCGGSQPQDAEVAPTRAPSYNGPTGPYPKCDICRDGDYPGNTAMVINMLYIGYGSCAQFYDIGRAGLIQTHLCDAIQHFAYEPCGCGEFNTNINKAPESNNGGGSSGGGNTGGGSWERKRPDSDGKDSMKLGNSGGRGGAGSGGLRQRTLKGAR